MNNTAFFIFMSSFSILLVKPLISCSIVLFLIIILFSSIEIFIKSSIVYNSFSSIICVDISFSSSMLLFNLFSSFFFLNLLFFPLKKYRILPNIEFLHSIYVATCFSLKMYSRFLLFSSNNNSSNLFSSSSFSLNTSFNSSACFLYSSFINFESILKERIFELCSNVNSPYSPIVASKS